MNPIPFAKTKGAHFFAVWLAMTAVACDSPDVFDICNDRPECYADGASDGVGRDRPLPPDSVVPDSGPSRSLLCGISGCFPGNWNACGPVPVPDSAYLAFPQADDASDSSDDVTADAALDASTDAADAAPSTDAQTDACRDDSRDASRDASPVDSSVDGGAADVTVDAAAPPQPDAGADEDGPTTSDAGPVDDGSSHDALADTGTSDEPRIVQSCYIKPSATGVTAECAPVGPGAEGSACSDSLECGALLACVEVDQKGVCRPVSCVLPALCLKGTYYEEAPLRVSGATRRDLAIPVCLPADNCTLLAPQNPCPAGKECAVVGSEGETTCREPGSAKVGGFCDDANRCSGGLLCSKFANQCVKICHVDSGPIDCPTGTCQGGNRSLPDGFGICVGQTDGG